MHQNKCRAVVNTNEEYSKLLGKRIGTLRQERNLMQEQLAAKLQVAGCDMTRSALAKIECGQRHLYPDELKALKTVLHVAYEELFL